MTENEGRRRYGQSRRNKQLAHGVEINKQQQQQRIQLQHCGNGRERECMCAASCSRAPNGPPSINPS
ncbi:hypothetical protein WR25_16380 [Diploscapter pachys]|uniref:Uncharacterized protein n=1 Tax=Diploscapter pachys TaxID=2018661 RepID=A0A2A2KUT3_9BILA|nr:hypothetical protein WR25_16380 [Diploscapter pachys]